MSAERAMPASSWWKRTRQDVALLLRVHRLLLREDWTRGRILIAILCLQAAIPIAQLWLTRAIVNALVGGNSDAAIGFGVATVVAVLVFQIVTPIQMVLASQIQDGGVAEIEREMIRAGSKLRDLTAIGSAGYLNRMNAIRDGAMEFGMTISRAGRFYAGAVSLIGILISLIALQPLMPILLIATGYLAHRFSRRQADLEYASLWAVARSGAEMRYAQHVATRAESAAEARMFGLGPWLRARYLRFGGETLAELGARRRSGALWAIFGTALHVVALAGSFWYVARQAESGALSVGDLALFINALIQGQFLTQDLFVSVQTLRRI
ncbi:MAG TPA: hypothetical protein VFQ54_04535, partial [Thermomicrobiales bacterium]|nr:hypothetical protein [Thermomicrobiales bacterium]